MNTRPKVSVLTGAGVSTSAGIQDFKSTDESWGYEEDRFSVLSVPFFKQEPDRFWEIYKELFDNIANLEPTPFHHALVELEDMCDVTVITQNIDRLHHKAGSTHVYEMHGNTLSTVCINLVCNSFAKYLPRDFALVGTPTCKDCHSPLKPRTVLFYESVNFMNEARESVIASDLLIVAGTSLAVGPVNELPHWATEYNIPVHWVNREEPPEGYDFDQCFIGDTDDYAIRH